jgi:hypothetical protein
MFAPVIDVVVAHPELALFLCLAIGYAIGKLPYCFA